VRIVRFGRIVMLAVLWALAGAGAAGAEKYAPVITSYVETDAQKQQMAKADEAYGKGDYETTKRLLAPLVEAGHPKATNYIGLMHDYGFGYAKDEMVACELYERAALNGYASAQWNTSICYHRAGGKNEMKRKYRFWIETAAENGNKKAQAHMAAYYYKSNQELFLYWAKKAAAQGNILAKVLLSRRDHGHLYPNLTGLDTACFVVMIGFFEKDVTYCD
jgi:TPR repeat protein